MERNLLPGSEILLRSDRNALELDRNGGYTTL